VAYLDIKAAFDSVNRLALWKALRGRGLQDTPLDLFDSLHENNGAQVRLGQDLSQCFVTTSGVRQDCVLVPALFCVAIDWILRHMPSKPGIEVGRSHFSDLVYADDTAFLLESANDAAISLSSFNATASTLGLRVSWPKTKLQNLQNYKTQPSTITVDGHPVDSVNSFVYLGSLQSSDCYSRPDINRRIHHHHHHHWPGFFGHVITTEDMEGQESIHNYKSPCLSGPSHLRSTICLRNMDRACL